MLFYNKGPCSVNDSYYYYILVIWVYFYFKVMDEADRILNMDFEKEVSIICLGGD